MGEFDLAATMDGLAARAATVVETVYPWPVEAVTVPCVLVDYPTGIDIAITDQRGDHVVVPVYFLVGQTGTKDARDALSAALTGAGDLVDAMSGIYSYGDVDVGSASIARIEIGGVTYLGLKFIVDVLT